MAVNPVAGASASAVAVSVPNTNASSKNGSVTAAMQEAMETAVQTQKEASSGDMQAVRLLAQERQKKMNAAPKGGSLRSVDHLA